MMNIFVTRIFEVWLCLETDISTLTLLNDFYLTGIFITDSFRC